MTRFARGFGVVGAGVAVSCGPSDPADRPPPEDGPVDGRHGSAVAVVRGRVVDARGRGAIVEMRYSGAGGRLHFTDNDGAFEHRLGPGELQGGGVHVTVMPLYAAVGETTMVWVRCLPSRESLECGTAGRGAPDTVTLRVELPPVRRPAG
jgi:hypothetical protein